MTILERVENSLEVIKRHFTMYRLFITELRIRKVRVTILLLILIKLNILGIQELLQFALLHFALKKLLHFALESYYISR